MAGPHSSVHVVGDSDVESVHSTLYVSFELNKCFALHSGVNQRNLGCSEPLMVAPILNHQK